MNSDDEILAVAREGFLDEAKEMLSQFEAALLAMERDPLDADAVNRAFRAAHTIKGAASLFGFAAVAAFTHEVESVLECMRAGELPLSEAGMALLLQGCDHIGSLLGEIDLDATPASCAAVDEGQGVPTERGIWRISIRMGPDAFRHGLDPMSFIRYLETIGRVVDMQTVQDALPDLRQLDAETCYLGFDIRLDTGAGRQAIEEVFQFMAADADIVYQPPQAEGDPDAPEPVAGARDRRDIRFIRVRADKLDKLIDLIGELVIASSGAQVVAQQAQSRPFSQATTRIHDLVQEVRGGALGLRMVPIGETFARFERVVRDVSKQLGKEVDLHITGADTELDKSMVESIADPLMHLVRNSLDHGIESAEERVSAGKSPVGRLALHAYYESGSIVVEVSDDGRGLDRERILAKAQESGLISAMPELSQEDIDQLIFLPGFSTAEQITDLSGRGVGMDVVKSNVETLRGQIKIASQPGLGSTVQIRLPLTLAIIDGFLTRVGGVSYVVPLALVAECLAAPPEYVADSAQMSGYFDLRGEVVPYLDLGVFYRHPSPTTGRRSLIVVRNGLSRVGLVVDRLLGEYQTVIKPLGQLFQQVRGLAGSTILGSGEVALILDVPALLDLATQRLNARPLHRER